MTNEKLLGVDFGEANIGLAFGSNKLTMPIREISGKNRDEAINQIIRVCLENRVNKVIVGLPLAPDGKLSQKALDVKRFVKLLKIRLKLPIEFFDERFSTKDALERALSYGLSQKSRRNLDSLSAQIILDRYYAEKS